MTTGQTEDRERLLQSRDKCCAKHDQFMAFLPLKDENKTKSDVSGARQTH